MAFALAGKADGIEKLLADGKIETAQAKCERQSAFLPETDADLREACARAMLPRAQAANTFKEWARFQADWAGTTLQPVARVGEARSRLDELGWGGSEIDYRAFRATYSDTPVAAEAEPRQQEAALKGILTAEDAKRVAREYPLAEGLRAAVAPWFADFVTVTVTAGKPSASVDPPLRGPHTLDVEWAGRTTGDPVPWDVLALRHLETQGLPPARGRVLKAKGESFPPCRIPDAQVGVRVRLGELTMFSPVDVDCGNGDDTGFLSVRDDRIVGLSLRPGPGLRFAGADGDTSIRHGLGKHATTIALVGTRGPDVLPVDNTLVEQVGRAYLIHPLSGDLPWYEGLPPPPSAQPLPSGLASSPVPKGVSLAALSTGDTQIEKSGHPAWTRTLPDGRVRVLSPLYQALTGLHGRHPNARPDPKLALPEKFWPEGAEPVELDEDNRARLLRTIGILGLTLTRAWQVQLDVGGLLEVPFEGRVGDQPVRGILDPVEGTTRYRAFVLTAPGTRDSLVQFRHDGATHIGWIGERSGRPALQVLRMGPTSLGHQWIVP